MAGACLLDLPDEVLANILGHLPVSDRARTARACSILRVAAARVFATSSYLDFKAGSSVMDAAWFSSVCLHLAPDTLKRLELDCWHLDDASLQHIPTSVEELTLSGCDHHSDALLEAVQARLSLGLRKFAFSGFSRRITKQPFIALAQRCRGLTALALDGPQSLDPNLIICAVASSCPGLQELSAYDLTHETLTRIQACGLSLTRFRLKCRHYGHATITDASLGLILAFCPHLVELQITDKTEPVLSLDFSDAGLLSLVGRASTLQILKLRFPAPGPITSCSAVALMQLANACTGISKLELSNLHCLSDPSLYEFIHRCPGLLEISIAGSSITNASLETLASHCPTLRSLNISACRKVSDAGRRALCRCTHLESVNVGMLPRLADSSIVDVCSAATRLKCLVLNQNTLSEAALRSIAQCSALEELALHGCQGVSNTGLKAIAAGCPGLRHVSLGFCDRISDSGVIAIANGCRKLEKIRLDGCRHLSNPCVRALCQPAWAACGAHSWEPMPHSAACFPGPPGPAWTGGGTYTVESKPHGPACAPGPVGPAWRSGGAQSSGWEPTGIGAAGGSTKTEEAAEKVQYGERLDAARFKKQRAEALSDSNERERINAARGQVVEGSVENTGASVTGQHASMEAALQLNSSIRTSAEACGSEVQAGINAQFQSSMLRVHEAREDSSEDSSTRAKVGRAAWQQGFPHRSDAEKTSTVDSERTAGPSAPAAAGSDRDGGASVAHSAPGADLDGGARSAPAAAGADGAGEAFTERSRLRYLSMHGCPKLSDKALMYLLSAPALRFVDLPRTKLTTRAILEFQLNRTKMELCMEGIAVIQD